MPPISLRTKKVLFIIIGGFVLFLTESVAFDFLGPWFKPNLLILLVVFITLRHGIRYGIGAACLAGLLKDSFTTNPFGGYLFCYILCAYLVMLVTKYFYEVEATFLKTATIFAAIILNTLLYAFLISFIETVDFGQVFLRIVLPEIALTMILADFTFEQLKKCALKFSV